MIKIIIKCNNNPHCDISSFHFVIIFLNCKESLWTPCKSKSEIITLCKKELLNILNTTDIQLTRSKII